MMDKVIQFELPWRTTCRLACQALIERCDFEQLIVRALEERLHRFSHQPSKQEEKEIKA